MRYLHIPGIRRIAFAVLFTSTLALPTVLEAQPVEVQLGEYGGTATLVRTESGRYTWNGQPVFDGSTITSASGKRYVLTFSGGEWRAGYLPRLVQVPLGASGSAITLRELENEQYWWNGLVESGLTITAADGDVYRLTFADGLWSADFVPDVLSVPLGRSGETVVLSRLQGGGYSHEGRTVRDGLQVRDSAGRVYEFTFRRGSWHADLAPVRPPPPPGGTGPDPSPVVRSDIRRAYVGVEPVLTTGEDGTRRSVLKIGGAEYSLHELFSQGNVTRGGTFAEEAAETIETILQQVELLASVYDDSPSGLRDAIRERWDLAEEALEGLFGRDNAEDIFGSVPLTRGLAVDIEEVVDTLEQVLAALSNYGDFYDAADDGVFEDAIDTDLADNAFDALRTLTKLEFGSTGNTRFGAYVRYERDGEGGWEDDLVLMDGDEGFGAFAYSPLEASRRFELPNRGEADYIGRTVAVSPDGDPNAYTGIFELNVRFASNRVSALIKDLRDEDGEPWRYGFGNVTSISLPTAQLDNVDASFEVSSGDASVRYESSFGAPGPRALRSDFEGTFIGRQSEAGDSVIGTWNLFSSTRRAPVLTGAFGADFDSAPTSVRPVVDDRGDVAETYIGARPDGNGDIRAGGKDENGDDLEFAASELFSDGSAESIGPTLVSLAKSEIERQIRLLDLWLEVTSSATELNRRRDTVWDSANETLFETVFGSNFRARNPLGASYPRDSRSNRDDEQARSLLLEAAYALGGVGRFEDALRLSGVFREESDAVEDADLMFEVRSHDVRVEFSHTDYGRFGIWSRTVGNSARDGIEFDPDNPSGAFAYSPLEQSRYFSADPSFPANGSGYYEGTTLAVDEGSGGPRFFEGQISLTVDWGASVGRATVTSVIQDLRTLDGNEAFQYNDLGVDQIVFSGGLRVAGGNGNVLEFDSSRPSVRLHYLNSFRASTRWSGRSAHTGKFVGASRDGPLGVIGTWELGASNQSVFLKGAYAADLVP